MLVFSKLIGVEGELVIAVKSFNISCSNFQSFQRPFACLGDVAGEDVGCWCED